MKLGWIEMGWRRERQDCSQYLRQVLRKQLLTKAQRCYVRFIMGPVVEGQMMGRLRRHAQSEVHVKQTVGIREGRARTCH